MPAEQELMRKLEQEASDCYAWSNGPNYRYAAHSHEYEKVLYCVRGSITFVIGDEGERLDLKPGDRMVLPPQTNHSAEVGPEGVTCVEGRR